MAGLLQKIFGTRNSRTLKKYKKSVSAINQLEDQMSALSDSDLASKTQTFRQRVQAGETLDDILPEAFAVCREASKRVFGMRHFDVQLIGGMTLHEGRIAEMRTGEGKTLVATLPTYLNTLAGGQVHLVTVNDYLAGRDAAWMQPLYEFLGLSVGVNVPGLTREQKVAAYESDIVYGTNNELGFDYLRDNMVLHADERLQKSLSFAIVDEVDSILIDEARTPLIISGPADDHSELYRKINQYIPSLNASSVAAGDKDAVDVDGDYQIDEKSRHIELTENGHQKIEEMLISEKLLSEGDSLYGSTNLSLLHHVMTGLRAHVMFNRDVHYIVQNGQVVLIDEHTGRTMEGRRLSEGLHQAIEAKEKVNIQAESQTFASTTFQNFFRLYDKLAGMTGTADTEAQEFHEIYGLEVVVIPTNVTVAREDWNDLIFLSQREKFDAVVDDVKACLEKNAPVLVGTASIESSEAMSAVLKQAGVKHKVLNAKFHAKEADIIAQAGRPGAVTIATNMAGRGTDIVLGGNLEAELENIDENDTVQRAKINEDWTQRHAQVLEAGGLHVLGTERHESRRIDNQLRGRSGRQGDPGVSRFYLSLDDDLMRIFASEKVKNFMQALGMEDGEAIEHRMVTNSIEKAQRKVEGRNFDMRKQLLEYDDVANDQRQIVYHQRNTLLEAEDVSETLDALREEVVNNEVSAYIPPGSVIEQWDVAGLESHLKAEFHLDIPVGEWLSAESGLYEENLRQRVLDVVASEYQKKSEMFGADMRKIECQIMLQVLDQLWKDHLASMDQLRNGIGLRGYAGKNPKQEYKRESYELFEALLERFKHDTITILSKIEINLGDSEQLQQQREEEQANQQLEMQHDETDTLHSETDEPAAPAQQPQTRSQPKVGRNDPCPCGSGKKYKQCHGKI